MNAPQQKAEAAARDLALSLTEQNGFTIRIGDCDHPTTMGDIGHTAMFISKSLHLPELFAIVEAAEATNKADLESIEALKKSGHVSATYNPDIVVRLKAALSAYHTTTTQQ
jgi:hypothetical protein